MENFKKLGLTPAILKAVEDLGFETPSEIQEKTIPVLLENDKDLVGLAQTGTGKTAAFGFPLLQKINPNSKKTQGLILAPTRELCLQIANEMTTYAKHIDGINIVAIYGGASITDQEKQIKRGAQIIAATPGRMKDMLGRGIIDISQIRYCILDEADEMLNMGFYDDITDILKYSKAEKYTWLFSATMPKEVAKIAKDFMTNPIEITAGNKNESTNNVSHEYYLINARDRYKVLKRLADYNPDIFSVIFCRTKRETQKVAERLIEDGYSATALHGDLSQNQRDLVMNSFRKRQVQMLVATDVAARGIDVDDISHVIHYKLPDETEVYTHRSGRTGRAGKSGVSIVLTTKSELSKIKKIEKIINQKFEQKSIPDGSEICQVQLFHLAENISNTEINPEIEKYLPELENNFENLTKEDLIKKIFSVEFTRFHDYYKDASDLNAKATQNYREGEDDGTSTRYFITLGSRDGFDWKSLKDFLRDELKLTRDEISRVEVKKSFAFFNTDTSERDRVFSVFENYKFQGRNINIELTNNQSGGSGKKRAKKHHRKQEQPKKRGSRRIPKANPGKPSKKSRQKNIKNSIKRRKKKRK